MARPGPVPKPTAVRILHGDHLERVNKAEPIPRNALPECPADVAPAVREIWDYAVAELAVMGVAKAADRDTLRTFCEAVVVHRRAARECARAPLLIVGAHGNKVKNPAFQILRDAAVTVRLFVAEFGLTPASRSRIVAGKPAEDPDNPFA